MADEKKITITVVGADGVAVTSEEAPLPKKKATDLGLTPKEIEAKIKEAQAKSP
jgi:hypothetical protein